MTSKAFSSFGRVSESNFTSLKSLHSITDSTERAVFASVQQWKSHATASQVSAMIKVASYGSLDEFGRAVAKSVVEVCHAAGNQRIKGDIHDTVKADLGTRTYSTICSSSVLECIHYCQSGLIRLVPSIHGILDAAERTQLASSTNLAEKARDLLNHDFLVLQFSHQDLSNKLYIRADKTGVPEDKAGIHIRVDNSFTLYADAVRLFTVTVGHNMKLDVVLENLEDHSPDYVLSTENCWMYARAAAKNVMLLCCGQVPALRDVEKDRLRQRQKTSLQSVAKNI